jgi:hypothetical protein
LAATFDTFRVPDAFINGGECFLIFFLDEDGSGALLAVGLAF